MAEPTDKKLSRRDALKALGTALGATALATLPPAWSKPVLAASELPEHARQSEPVEVCSDPLGESQTFNYIGQEQSFTVPADVCLITVEAYGAQGGTATSQFQNGTIGLGGLGGLMVATIAVTPGETLTVNVGGQGPSNSTGGTDGGYNGGGGSTGEGAGGGGASDVSRGSTKLVVAGGGGGTGFRGFTAGGNGGGTTGQDGDNSGGAGGGGGTQAAGGAGGSGEGGYATDGTPGTLGQGGIGGAYDNDGSFTTGGGGGGGGYYGGGGGGGGGEGDGGGGGGGSSYAEPSATDVTYTPGMQSGDGMVVISW